MSNFDRRFKKRMRLVVKDGDVSFRGYGWRSVGAERWLVRRARSTQLWRNSHPQFPFTLFLPYSQLLKI